MSKADRIQYDENKLPYIDLGTAIIRWEKEEAPEWALAKAREELRELPEIVEPAIKELRELIQSMQGFIHKYIKHLYTLYIFIYRCFFVFH